MSTRRGRIQLRAERIFYDAAEGLLTAVILLLAEYLPPREIDGALRERRHIVSVFKLVQELLAPSILPGKNEFQLLMERLPEEHKAAGFPAPPSPPPNSLWPPSCPPSSPG